ncbi:MULTISPECIES: hypothetical protein [unclassified Microbacterium]|uniref:hypothetical protein n=1 Tax=unclassified Microbacterium TaxID=2609290 RepID=UPI003015FDBB
MSGIGSSPRRAALSAATIVGNAAVQAAAIALAPRLPLDALALVLAALSGAAILGSTVILWGLALRRAVRRTLMVVAPAALATVIVAVAAPYLLPLVIALVSPVIAGDGLGRAWSLARRRPWSTIAALLLTVVAVLLATVVAMLLGLLLPGPLGAAAAWLVTGAGAVALIGVWARLAHAIADPARDRPGPSAHPQP